MKVTIKSQTGRINVRPPLLFDGATLSIPRASATQNGYLSRNDFILFSGGEAVAVTSFNTRTGEVLLLDDDVLAALGYTPLNKAGDTMTGPLTLAGPPANSLHAVTKAYADSLVVSGASARPGLFFVADYGASGSKITFNGAITTGSTTLTLTTSAHDFVVGQGINIVGAGNIASIDPGSNLLVSTITAIAGATITIANAALHTVSGAVIKHDDTVAIQAAINDCFAAGGLTVYFDTYGYYRINKGFTDYDSILKVPHVSWLGPGGIGAAPTPTIRFHGDGNTVATALNQVATVGPVIQTDLIGATATSSMLSAQQYVASADIVGTCITIIVEGLTFRTYDNPQICGVDMGMVWNFYAKDLCFDAGVMGQENTQVGGSQPGASEPTHNTFGIRFPRVNACTISNADNVSVTNYGIGIIASELFHATTPCFIQRCKVGFQTHETAANYPFTGQLLICHCATGVQWLSHCPCDIHVEFETCGSPAWATAIEGRYFYDPNDVATGKISYLNIGNGTASPGGNRAATWTGLSKVAISSLGGFANQIPNVIINRGHISADEVIARNSITLWDGAGYQPLLLGANDSGMPGFRDVITHNAVATLLTGLVSYWKMDEAGDGTQVRYDQMEVNNFVPSIYGPVPAVAGKIGSGAASGSGGGGFMTARGNASQNFAGSFSISGWMKIVNLSSGSGFAVLLSKGGTTLDRSYDIYWRNDLLRWEFGVTSNGSTGATAIVSHTPTVNTWYHVVAVFNSSTNQIFLTINNGAVGSVTQPFTGPVFGNIATGLSTMLMYNGTALRSDCIVDEIGLWNRALTGAEITALYGGGSPPAYPF
jgi:hypothetical protein